MIESTVIFKFKRNLRITSTRSHSLRDFNKVYYINGVKK